MVIVPYKYAISNRGMHIHGVEECDLSDIDWKWDLIHAISAKRKKAFFIWKPLIVSLISALVQFMNEGVYLGGTMPTIPMTEHNAFGVTSDRQVAHIYACLPTSKNHYMLAFPNCSRDLNP